MIVYVIVIVVVLLLLFFIRPIAGNINFCPTAFDGDSDDDFIFDVTKHELAHALVTLINH